MELAKLNKKLQELDLSFVHNIEPIYIELKYLYENEDSYKLEIQLRSNSKLSQYDIIIKNNFVISIEPCHHYQFVINLEENEKIIIKNKIENFLLTNNIKESTLNDSNIAVLKEPSLTLAELNTIARVLDHSYGTAMAVFQKEYNVSQEDMKKLDDENRTLNPFERKFTPYLIALNKIEAIKEHRNKKN